VSLSALREYFFALSDYGTSRLQGEEHLLLNLHAEDSDFVRFNTSQVRQPGHVRRIHLALRLIDGRRHAESLIDLCEDEETDRARLDAAIGQLRDALKGAPEDPHLRYSGEAAASSHKDRIELPSRETLVETMLAMGEGRDLVGIATSGTIVEAFASSLGGRFWHETGSYNLDWSFYHRADKAVKCGFAGQIWDAPGLEDYAERQAAFLQPLQRDPITLEPGHYAAYLAPAAVLELLQQISWGGFSQAAVETKTSVLQRLVEGRAQLSKLVSLTEDRAGGGVPAFQSEGFARAPKVPLVKEGAWVSGLVSPETAGEFGLDSNGAEPGESPEALAMAPGDLPEAEALSALGTGLYVSNLWYLNFSDRAAGRITGMTRFATFWVENGEIVAPVNVMRFDDTIYNLLGASLRALTKERAFIMNNRTYGGRSLETSRVPGALVEAMAFTL